MCMISLGTLAAIGGTAIGLTSAGLGMAGAISNGVAQKRAAEQQQEMLDRQAQQYVNQAEQVEEQGQWEKRELALQQSAEHGNMIATQGASGALIGTGTNLVQEQDLSVKHEYEQRQKSFDIANKAYDLRMKAYNAGQSAEALNTQIGQASLGMGLGIGSSILGGVASGLSVSGGIVSLGKELGFGAATQAGAAANAGNYSFALRSTQNPANWWAK